MDIRQELEGLRDKAAGVLDHVNALLTSLPAPARRVVRPSPSEFQSALDSAQPGDIIELARRTTYPGAVLRPVAGASPVMPITITTMNEAEVDVRRSLTGAEELASIAGQTSYGLKADLGASFYDIRDLCLRSNADGQGDQIQLGDGQTTDVSKLPHDFVIRRCVFFPDSAKGQKRGIACNARNVMIRKNFFDGMWSPGTDSQCVAMWSGTQGATIYDNHLDAASEPVIIGGAYVQNEELVPAEIVIANNYVRHNPAWRGLTDRNIKNLFEVKFGRDILVIDNVFDGHWPQAQSGYAIVFTLAVGTASQGAKPQPWAHMKNVRFTRNRIKNVSAAFSILGRPYSNLGGQIDGLMIDDNLVEIDSVTNGGNGFFALLQAEPKNVKFRNNTVIHTGSNLLTGSYGAVYLADGTTRPGGAMEGFEFTQNVIHNRSYGVKTPEGNNGLNREKMFPGAIIGQNVIVSPPKTHGYDATNQFPVAASVYELDPTLIPAGWGSSLKL